MPLHRRITALPSSWKKILFDCDPEIDFDGFEATDFHDSLHCVEETKLTLQCVVQWLEGNEADPGYQVLSTEEKAEEMLAARQETVKRMKNESVRELRMSYICECLHLINFVDVG